MAEYEEKKREEGISELPESLLHDILSRIPIRDAVRTSVLSKKWNYIWEKFPFLIFDERFYTSYQGNAFSIDEVYCKNEQLMKKSKQMILNRCREEDSNIITLRWVIPDGKNWENSSSDLQELVSNLAKTRLQELSIVNNNNYFGIEEFREKYPKLPSRLVLPDSIKKLYFNRLGGLKSLLAYGTVKFKYLTSVYLEDVVMEDGAVNGLKFSCHSLRTLSIHDCSGLKDLHLTGLPELKNIVLVEISSLEILKIESLPKIKLLSIKFNQNLSRVDIINTNVDSVRQLNLYGNFLTQDLFNEFVNKCRFLELLDVGVTENLKKINISMDALERIIIINVKKLVRIEITAPALENFQFFTNTYINPPTIFWNFPNSETEVFVVLNNITIYDWFRYVPVDDKHKIWLNFFQYFRHAKELHLRIPPEFLIWIKREGSVSPLRCLENIVYYTSFPTSIPIPHLLVSLIFLAPRATTISFKNHIMSRNSSSSNIIFKIQYGEQETNHGFEFFGIEDWSLSVSKMILEKYHGNEYDLMELIKFFHEIKPLKLVLPKEGEFEVD